MIKKTNAKQYFRSFEEFIGSSEQSESLNEVLEHDFAQAASQAGDGLSRRRWMQLMGASMAFGSMVGCRMGKEQIAPFVFRPHNRIPGVPEKYATSVEFAGVARPLLATCVDGRPIKLDGNADHPSSGSGTDAFTQAMILDLYDPDRSRSARIDGKDADWESLLTQVTSFLGVDGRGVAVLAEPTTSPTANRLKQEFMAKYPQAAWYEFTSISNDNERAATKLAFGKPLQHRVLYDQAQIIVTLDADPLGLDPNAAENVRRFTAG
ncbi:MAG TPA: molybdopterin oxidoreductase, partial [Pirellulaceae bacterium]|nr:molybdopterin oxidoreductase [Pirellulaceae bacterium]